MKKIFKKLSFAMAMLMSFSLALPILAKIDVFAAIAYISIEDFESTAIKDELYTIKDFVDCTDVKDPLNRSIFSSVNASGEFTPSLSGNYKITYTLGGKSTDLNVYVSSGVAQGTEIKFEENSKYIVPAKINPDNDGEDTKVVLPNPYVVDKDGEIIDSATVTTEVLLDGVVTTAGVATETIEGVDYTTLTLNKDTEGTYLIKYKYMSSGKLIAFTTKTIVADADYENDYEFSYSYVTTKPSTAEIGVATKLPKVTATNKTTEESVNVYYTVKAEITVGTTTTTYQITDTTNDVITFVDGYYYFTPILDGEYVITYDVKNFAGNSATVASASFTISNVADTVKAIPVPVLPYTLNEQGILTSFTDATEAIPSNSSIDNIFIMPIYATDSANGIVEDNLTLYRTIVKSGQSTVLFDESDVETNIANKVLLINGDETLLGTIDTASDTETIVTVYVNGNACDITKAQIYVVDTELTETGTYNINYNANDAAQNGINSKTYQMVVTNSFVDETAPVITFTENLPSVMFGDDEITFAKPTATDNKDTRLSVYLTYKTTTSGIESTETRVDDANSIISYDEDTEKYTLKLTDAFDANTTKIEIIAYANDDSYDGTPTSVNLGSTFQSINILYTGDASATEIFDAGDWAIQSQLQGNDIVLPTLVYSDDLINYLDIDIIVECDGTYFNAFDAEYVRDLTLNTLTIQNAKFTADLAGDYTVTFITTDAGNNITIIFYTITIATNPGALTSNFTGLPTQINSGTAEKGVSFDLPNNVQVYLSDTNTLEVVGDIQLKVKGFGYSSDNQTYFTAKQVGTYQIYYWADVRYKVDVYDGLTLLHSAGDEFVTDGLVSKKFTIEVVDTTGPSADYTEIENFFADKNATKFEKGGSFVLPSPDFGNDTDLDLSTSNITITSSTTTVVIYLDETIKLETAQTFSRDDTYTITYNLLDTTGNTTTNAFTLDVGDVIPPVLDVDSDIIAEEYSINDVIIVDLSKISAIDDIDEEILLYNETTGIYSVQSGASFSITLKNTTTGTTITNDLTSSSSDLNYQFTITTAGEYTMTITASDLAGKTATYSDATFTVSEDNNGGLSSEEILGIVLIVLSVILLGGVITYFVISKKKLEKKYK